MKEFNGVTVTEVKVGDAFVPGIAVEIPGIGKSVLQIRCKNGLLLCGLFSPEKIESMEFAACVFSAPQFSNMLANHPLFVSSKAKEMGITEEMTGEEIARIFEA